MRTEFFEFNGWFYRVRYIKNNILISKIKLWQTSPSINKLLEGLN